MCSPYTYALIELFFVYMRARAFALLSILPSFYLLNKTLALADAGKNLLYREQSRCTYRRNDSVENEWRNFMLSYVPWQRHNVEASQLLTNVTLKTAISELTVLRKVEFPNETAVTKTLCSLRCVYYKVYIC